MATPTLVQSQTASTLAATATSLTATFGSTPTQNNLLVAAAGSDDTLAMTSSGWTLATSAVSNQAAYLWYKLAGASEPTAVQVTITPTASDTIVLGTMEFSVSGGWAVSPLDKIASNTGHGGTFTSLATGTTAATTVANELAIAIENPHAWSSGASAPTTPTWSASYTNIVTVPGTTGSTPTFRVALFVASNTLVATGTQTTTGSWTNSSTDVGALIATFKINAPAASTGNFFRMF